MKMFLVIMMLAIVLVSPSGATDKAPPPPQAPPIPLGFRDCDCGCNPCTCHPCHCGEKEYYSDPPPQAPAPVEGIFPTFTIPTTVPAGSYNVFGTTVTLPQAVKAGTYRLMPVLLAEPTPTPQYYQYQTVCGPNGCSVVPTGYYQSYTGYQQWPTMYSSYQDGSQMSGRQPIRNFLRKIFKGRSGRGGC